MLLISRSLLACSALAVGCLVIAGCGAPSRVNIELRKEIQELRSQNQRLAQQHQADLREISALRDRAGALPTLPSTRLGELYTTHGLEFGRLTGGARIDPHKPGDQGVAVYVSPVDQSGQKIKAAGTFDVSLFDLDEPQRPLVGQCHFNLQQARDAWNGVLFEYGYVLICPFQTPPHHANLTVKVRFFDELTQTPFSAQTVVQVQLPAATSQPG